MINSLKRVFKPLSVFYLLVFYIFSSLIWWSFLLINKNNDLYEEKLKVIKNEYLISGKTQQDFENSPLVNQVKNKRERQNTMVIGESIAFLIILLFGTIKIHSAINKEILLNRQQRNFLLSITHELKSPLTGIKLSVETLKNRVLKKEQQEMFFDNALNDVDRLKTLVDNLLMAAKIENEGIELSKQNINFSELIQEIFEQYQKSYASQRVLKLIALPNIFVVGDRMALTSIVSNLIENAIKYSNEESPVNVVLTQKKSEIVLSIIDEGNGIEESEKNKIFKKFYRIGSEDTRSTKGTGLGLYIVKELVEKHNGTIKVLPNAPKGSNFQINFYS